MNSLRFTPEWYLIGNSDEPGLAIAYGVVAMATVWMFESIVSTVLFTKGLNISLSEVAALVCHNGCSWRQLLWWLFKGKRSKRNGRAHFAVVLRIFVTLVDIAIIILAVPTERSVTERDVGMSQLSLRNSNSGLPLLRRRYSGSIPNPCIWDRVRFSQFTPSAALLICINGMDDSALTTKPNSSFVGFTVKYDSKRQRLKFQTVPDNRIFFLTHNLLVPANDKLPGALTFNLPLPKDIEQQAEDAVVADTNCRNIASSSEGRNFECNSQSVVEVRRNMMAAIMNNLYTSAEKGAAMRKVQANRNHTEVLGFTELGNVNRPILCIYPALIVLAGLTLIYLLLRVTIGGGNIEMKLFKLAAEAASLSHAINPLFVTRKSIPLRTDDFETEPVENMY